MGYNYSAQNIKENTAKALALNAGVSTKQAIEVCNYIRGKPLARAKKELEEIIAHKRPLPMRRFNQEGTGHKPGIGPGKYPENTCSAIHDLLENAESNAKFKGLDTTKLKIIHILANRGPQQMRHGRKRGVVAKRTHLEVVVEVPEEKPKTKKSEKPESKAKTETEASTPKTESTKKSEKTETKASTPKTESTKKSESTEAKPETKASAPKTESTKKSEKPKTEKTDSKPESAKPETKASKPANKGVEAEKTKSESTQKAQTKND
ncbi:MAG: 50S ribosomal protein L22 [Candidatus Woesearchaeota archaeon]